MANQTRQLAALLTAEGCAVEVVQTNVSYRPAWTARLRGIRALIRLLPYTLRLWRALQGAELVHVMSNSGWAWHLFTVPAVWIATLRGVPVLVNYRGGTAAAFFARQFVWVRPTLKRADVVVVPSGFLREVFEARGVETTVVPNIVDLARFSPADSPPPGPHVVVTRNLEPVYDVATALRAFARVVSRVPSARLTIAGSGPQRAELEQLASKLGIENRVRFTGRLDNTELPALYRTASVALNSSLADNMPISLLEAMASGVPIVSTRVGGIPHFVEDGTTALLVPTGDAVAMADAIVRLLDDPELTKRIANAAIAAASRFSWSSVRPQLLRAYEVARAARRSSANAPRARDSLSS